MNDEVKKTKNLRIKPFFIFVYWVFSVVLWESVLHVIAYDDYWQYACWFIGFSIIFALVLTVLSRLFGTKANKAIFLIISIVLFVIYASQLVYYRVFGSFYSVSNISLGGGAITSFWRETLSTIAENAATLLLMFIPVAAAIILTNKKIILFKKRKSINSIIHCGIVAVLTCAMLILLRVGGTGYYTVYDFYHGIDTQTEQSVNCFGIATTFKIEFLNRYFGHESAQPPVTPQDDVPIVSPNWVYDFNLEELNALTDNDSIKIINDYVCSASGTNKNEYTGMFKGKNIIEICAESFSPALLDTGMFPALSKLANEGIVFTNYYTSFPSVTVDAEYAFCMGNFPDISRSKWDSSFMLSEKNYLPYCMGNALKAMPDYNYSALGFHNYKGSYFERDKSHPNMGYQMYFMNSGMKFTSGWITSDLEMMEQALDYIFEAGEPFAAYFMTFSGHYQYNFETNPMAIKNRDKVKDLDRPEVEQAYIACNLELEYAIEYLLQQLEEKNILDDTVIVLTGDHYPYGLTEKQYESFIGHKLKDSFEKYKNSFICWTNDLEEPIVCDNYCCNIDILPTLLNLFGVEYDSRLLTGTDVLSNGTHVAIIKDQSFICDKMSFNSSKNQIEYFTDPDRLQQGFFEYMVGIVKNKFNISTRILNTDYFRFLEENNVPKITESSQPE